MLTVQSQQLKLKILAGKLRELTFLWLNRKLKWKECCKIPIFIWRMIDYSRCTLEKCHPKWPSKKAICERSMRFSIKKKANLGRQVESQRIVGIEPTLTRTIPASFKSSTKDLKMRTTQDEDWYTHKSYLNTMWFTTIIICTSRVSSLEAFSYYPTSGSFAALSSRATAFTGYSPQRFLSYWVAVLSR